MDATDLKHTLLDYLWKHIPISKMMGVTVDFASADKIILEAPFANNINHMQTVFGGSLHAVATLACWSFLHVNLLEKLKEPAHIVISSSEIKYLAPVTQNFKSECCPPDTLKWDLFLNTLTKKNKARIGLQAKIVVDGQLCVDYHGTFVALKYD